MLFLLSYKDGIYINVRPDGSLFSLRRLQTQTKTKEKLVREVLFADAAALIAHTESAMQTITSCFAETAQFFSIIMFLSTVQKYYNKS